MVEDLEAKLPEGKTIRLEQGRTYSICTCGHSKNLPYCDNEHRRINEEQGTSYKSLKIILSQEVIARLHSSTWPKKQI